MYFFTLAEASATTFDEANATCAAAGVQMVSNINTDEFEYLLAARFRKWRFKDQLFCLQGVAGQNKEK